MSASLLYLYGVLHAGADVSALEGVEANSELLLIEHGGIGCAASPVPADDYERRLDATAEQLAWLEPRAWRHHEVLRQLHRRRAVIPFKFGTLCSSADDACAMLRDLPPSVADTLAHVDGKDEWTMRIAAQAAPASTFAIDALPQGHAYFARKRLQQVTADRLVASVDEIEAAVSGRLAALGAEVAQMPRPRRGDRHEVVAESAVLIRRTAFAGMEASVREFEEAHGPYVRFELVGPWPPYSFASICQSTPPAYDSQRPL